MFHKRCLSVFLICLFLFSLCPLLPASAATAVQLTPAACSVEYSFTVAGEEYVRVFYSTSFESGNFVAHGKDGVFSGEISMPYSAAGGKVTVTVKRLDDRELGKNQAQLPPVPDHVTPSGSSRGKVQQLVLTETTDGFAYSFTASGASYLMLNYSNRQQKATFPIYPDENGLFSGEVSLPITYARTLTTVKILSSSGSVLKEDTVRKAYEAPPAPEAQEGRLSGVTVCIDPGHQENGRPVSEPVGPGLKGKTAGTSGMAQGKFTLRKEAIVTLEIAMVLRDELIRQGATVVLTREKQDQFLTNMERCAVAEEANADIMLRLHCDTRANTKKRGFSVFGPLHSTYAQAVADKDTYRQMGTLLLNELKKAVGYELDDATGYVYLSDQFVGNNWAKMTCFLVEMGFMSNAYEDFQLSHPDYQQTLAEGMAQGVYEIALYRGWISAQ